jgi:hypothetical protein
MISVIRHADQTQVMTRYRPNALKLSVCLVTRRVVPVMGHGAGGMFSRSV